ncbi:unnamed protein product, partial [Porites evermanni]
DSGSENEDDWEEMGDEEQENSTICLFCEESFRNADNIWNHCVTRHGVDILKITRMHRLDFYGCIKLVNFIRKMRPPPESLKSLTPPVPWESDEFLRPVLPNDGLLQYDFDDDSDVEVDRSMGERISQEAGSIPYSQYLELKQRLQHLENRAHCAEANLARAVEDIHHLRSVAQGVFLEGQEGNDRSRTAGSNDGEDESYFSSYAHFGIHEEMLKDKTRTESYRDFILNNPTVFKDKVTMILDLAHAQTFCTRAGPKRSTPGKFAYIRHFQRIGINAKEFEKTLIHFKSDMSEVSIVSDEVSLFFLSPYEVFQLLTDKRKKTKYYSTIPRDYKEDREGIPHIHQQNGGRRGERFCYSFCRRKRLQRDFCESCVSETEIKKGSPFLSFIELTNLDVTSCKQNDLQFKSPFSIEVKKDSQCSAFVAYFDIFFEKNCDEKVNFSTSPSHPPTHWKQTVFYLEHPINVIQGQILEGFLACTKNSKDPRSLDISIEVTDASSQKKLCQQSYLLQ